MEYDLITGRAHKATKKPKLSASLRSSTEVRGEGRKRVRETDITTEAIEGQHRCGGGEGGDCTYE